MRPPTLRHFGTPTLRQVAPQNSGTVPEHGKGRFRGIRSRRSPVGNNGRGPSEQAITEAGVQGPRLGDADYVEKADAGRRVGDEDDGGREGNRKNAVSPRGQGELPRNTGNSGTSGKGG